MTYAISMACAYLLLMSMDGLSFLDRMVYGEWDNKGGDHLTVALNLLAMVASLFLLATGLRARGLPRLRDILPFAAVGYFLVSAAWSGAPEDTVRHSINYLFVVAGALGIAQTMPPRHFMKLLVSVCAFAAVASVVLRVIAPAAATMFIGYDSFRGIFPHKNTLGQAMSAGVLAALYCLRAEPRGRVKYTLLTALFLALALAGGSATSLLVIAVYLVFGCITTLYLKGGAPRVASLGMLALAMTAIVMFVFLPDIFFQAIGKDPTLTGRTDLWPYVIEFIYQRPLLGWGFGGFWVGDNPAVDQIAHAVGWLPPEAHNGGLEFLLQTGVAGTAIMLCLIIRSALLSVRCLRTREQEFGIATLLFLGGLMLMAVSEEILISPGQIQTMLFFATFFIVERAASPERGRAPLRRGAAQAALGRTPAR